MEIKCENNVGMNACIYRLVQPYQMYSFLKIIKPIYVYIYRHIWCVYLVVVWHFFFSFGLFQGNVTRSVFIFKCAMNTSARVFLSSFPLTQHSSFSGVLQTFCICVCRFTCLPSMFAASLDLFHLFDFICKISPASTESSQNK